MTKRGVAKFDDEIVIIGDTYYYRGTPLGYKKRIERSLKIKVGALQKDVLKEKKAFLESVERLGSGNVGRNTVHAIILRYLSFRQEEASNKEKPLSPKTIQETTILINKHLIPYFGRMKIEDVDQANFAEYCSFKKKASINLVNHRKVMNHFLKWCVQYGFLKYRPELQIPRYAVKSRRQREILTDKEIKDLLSNSEGRALLYIMFYLLMGMRNSEICKLRWSEIDLENAALQVNKANNRVRKQRVIPINRFVLDILKNEHKSAKTDWVFPSKVAGSKYPHINPEGGIRKPWASALESAGITRNITPHDLRATFEKFMHTNKDFTDTQREKMAGANIDVQKNIYVTMDADNLRGLENSVNVPGLDTILIRKSDKILGEKRGEKVPKRKRNNGSSN